VKPFATMFAIALSAGRYLCGLNGVAPLEGG
jgi:hypothetical protein